MKNINTVNIALIMCFLTFNIYAQEPNTKNTLKLIKGQQQNATIKDVKWLAGNWIGLGFGNFSQEVWSKPKAHSMMGMFRMVKDEQVSFYEIFHIVEKSGSLLLEIKHFNADLTAWESKDKKVQFPLIKIQGKKAWFDGLTYQRVGDKLTAWVAIAQKDGKTIEGEFVFNLQ